MTREEEQAERDQIARTLDVVLVVLAGYVAWQGHAPAPRPETPPARLDRHDAVWKRWAS